MRLQKNTLLALCSVLEFAAEPARALSTAEIARKYRASPHHLAKVLGRLRRAGLLSAARGSGGGYRFSANAKRVTLLDVIALFERIGAPAKARTLALEGAIAQVLAEIDATARATFGSVTLETMLKLARRPPAARGRAA
ncbi:MAG TPA: Rrf2 family transcriptional regulator [Burkholderiales bacterium]